MRNLTLLLTKTIWLIVVVGMLGLFNQCKEPASLSALIISDSENAIKEDLKTILENSGLFDAEISKEKTPDFAKYDVLVLHLSRAAWSEEVKSKFISYVNGGGGVVILGASSMAFGEWAELNKLVGITTGDNLSRSDESFEFQLIGTKEKHPVTEGLLSKWMHTEDYLIFNSEALTGNADVLATAWADTLQGGNGAHLPVLFTVNFGEGRIFHSTLGTAVSTEKRDPIQCVGFITMLQRGAEWAATGVVSQEAPIDFPNSVSTHIWGDYEALKLDEILERSMTYKVGKSKKYLTDFSLRLRNCDGKVESYAMYEDKILQFLESDATIDSKKYMCRELSWMGSEKSISTLEKLINDKDLSESASYALQRLRM